MMRYINPDKIDFRLGALEADGEILLPLSAVRAAIAAAPGEDVVSREDYDRRGRIIDSYALQYGTARDKSKVIMRIKREGACEILDEIEKRERRALPEAAPIYVLTQEELEALRCRYQEAPCQE